MLLFDLLNYNKDSSELLSMTDLSFNNYNILYYIVQGQQICFT